MTVRLVIVADDPLSASDLRRAIRATTDFHVLDGYVEGRGFCGDYMTAREPDVVIIDDMVARMATVARICEIRESVPQAKIVLLSAEMEPEWLAKASGAGVDAAVAKTPQLGRLGGLIREVANGRVYHAFAPPRASLQSLPAPGAPSLTERELEILRLVAAGAPNGRIAAQLWITEQTVKFHLSNVYRKLGVSNRTAASHHAYVHGLIDAGHRSGVAA
jgi:DNA-binding NarL/FixJ family response regulator